jgi:hypothetical protein
MRSTTISAWRIRNTCSPRTGIRRPNFSLPWRNCRLSTFLFLLNRSRGQILKDRGVLATGVPVAVENSKPSTRNHQGYRGVIQRVSHAILRFQFETVPLCDRVLSTLIRTETNT